MVSLDLFLFHEFGLTSLTNVQSDGQNYKQGPAFETQGLINPTL